jgi:hypothetical protein
VSFVGLHNNIQLNKEYRCVAMIKDYQATYSDIGLTFKIEATGGQQAAGDHGVVFFWVVFLVWEWQLVLRVHHWS